MTELLKYDETTSVTVTELAQMGMCEKQILFDEEFGKKRSHHVQQRAREGKHAHKQYEQQLSGRVQDKRCFIATCIFGIDARETQILRAFRDQTLLTTRPGKVFVTFYYAVSPQVVKFIEKAPVLKRPIGPVLKGVVKLILRTSARTRS